MVQVSNLQWLRSHRGTMHLHHQDHGRDFTHSSALVLLGLLLQGDLELPEVQGPGEERGRGGVGHQDRDPGEQLIEHLLCLHYLCQITHC